MKLFKMFKKFPLPAELTAVASREGLEVAKLGQRLDLAGALLRAIEQVPNVTYVDGPQHMRFLCAPEHVEELKRVGQWLEDQRICSYAVKRIRPAYPDFKNLHMEIPHKIFDELPLVLKLATKPSSRYRQAENLNTVMRLRNKAHSLCKHAGAPSFIVTRTALEFVEFSVPENVKWTLEPLQDYLMDAHCEYGLGCEGGRATLTLDSNDLLELPVPDKPEWTMDTGPDEAEAAAECDECDEGDLDDLEDEEEERPKTIEVSTARLDNLKAIKAAAQKVVDAAEYRVNHLFKGESSSYYVRKEELDALRKLLEGQ